VADHSNVPSLRELTARFIRKTCNTTTNTNQSPSLNLIDENNNIINNAPINTNNNHNSNSLYLDAMDIVRPDLDISVLPLELQEYLQAHKQCAYCQDDCFHEFWELIRFVKFEQHNDELPVFMRLCSSRCLHAAKTETQKYE